MQDKVLVGQFIKKAREEKGLTQKQLAEQLFVTSQAVSKWETGQNYPDIPLFEGLADALDITVLELMRAQRNTTDISLSTQAETVVDSLLIESGEKMQTLQKKVRHLSVILLSILIFIPILIAALSSCGFYLLKDEKNLEEALLTMVFLCLAATIIAIKFSFPLLGILLTRILQKSSLFHKKQTTKKYICAFLYGFFLIWLLINIVSLI